jgi:hypothetical protein
MLPGSNANGVADDIGAPDVAGASARGGVVDVDTTIYQVNVLKLVAGKNSGVNVEKVFV